MNYRIWLWIDRRGYIPFWAKWFWPYAHWCPEVDDLLILDNLDDCFCGIVSNAQYGIDALDEFFDGGSK